MCVSSIGCSPALVNLYDSLYHDVISEEVEEQTTDLLGGNLIKLIVFQCNSKLTIVTVVFLQLLLPVALLLELIPVM